MSWIKSWVETGIAGGLSPRRLSLFRQRSAQRQRFTMPCDAVEILRDLLRRLSLVQLLHEQPVRITSYHILMIVIGDGLTCKAYSAG
jgi:hypothetical protein